MLWEYRGVGRLGLCLIWDVFGIFDSWVFRWEVGVDNSNGVIGIGMYIDRSESCEFGERYGEIYENEWRVLGSINI